MKISDNTEVVGIIVLFIGVILLALTFSSAYGFLSGKLQILASADLTELFGRAMAPLIEAIIHILYLGIMGWIGSILTIRGVQLLKKEKAAPPPQPQTSQVSRQQIKPEIRQQSPATPSASPAPEQKAETKQVAEAPRPAEPEKPQIREQPKETSEQATGK